MHPKRLRLFAGPNGSGKTTILKRLPKELNLGYIVNADDIEKTLFDHGVYSFNKHDIHTSTDEFQDYIKKEGFSQHKLPDRNYIEHTLVKENHLQVPREFVNSYLAADIAGFIRAKHLEENHTFTFESVLSHPSKLDLLKTAKSKGYRIYVYYVATESVEINVNRVMIRVSQHGHPVPEESIRSRYIKSLNLLYDTIKLSDRAYIFDNSGKESLYIAEITNGEDVELHCNNDQVPNWFIEHIINKALSKD